MLDSSSSLLFDFWADLQNPQLVAWQVATLVLCFLLAWLLAWRLKVRRVLRAQAEQRDPTLSERWLQRLVFPLSALIFVWLAQPILSQWYPVSLLMLAIPLLASMAVIRVVFFALRLGLPKAAWLGSFEKVFAALVWLIFALHLLGILPRVILLLDRITLGVGSQQISLWTLFQGVASVLVGLLIALWLGALVSARLMAIEGIETNLRQVFARLAQAALLVLAFLIGLPLAGIDLTMLSVFGGALGVGLGFGLQKIAANYISGFIILLDRSIKIGDLIQVDAQQGVVTDITTRYSLMRNMAGQEIIVPNEMLISSMIVNEMHSDSKIRLALPVQVAYGSDLELVQQILCKSALTQARVLTDPAPVALIMAFTDSGINCELRVWIADPELGTGQVRSDINLAIWHAFQKEGIEIPFPQRHVHLISS